MVETSVAVATPPPTAARMMKGSTSAGPATSAVLPMTESESRRTPVMSSWRAFQRARMASASSNTMAMAKPALNSPAIETPATEPSTIKTIEGGTVSAMAAPVESSAISSLGW